MLPQSGIEPDRSGNPRGGPRAWLKALAYFAVSGLVCLGLMELILSLFFPVLAEERQVYHQDMPGLKKEVVYQCNRFGLRTQTVETRTPPPSTCRIICLGASTVQQSTKNLDDTWPDILRGMLAREFADQGLRIEVAAFGWGGMRALDRLVWLKEGLPVEPRLNVLSLRPDIIVLLEGVNDMNLGGGPEDVYDDLEEKLSCAANKARKGFKGLILDHSQLLRRLRVLYHKIYLELMITRGEAWYWGGPSLEEHKANYRALPFREEPERAVDTLTEFEFALKGIVEILKESGVKPVLLSQPVLWKEDMSPAEEDVQWIGIRAEEGWVRSSGAWLEREMARFNQAQARIARESGTLFIDLEGRIPKNLDYFFDHCHFTDKGSLEVARTVFPAMRDLVARMEREGAFK